MALPPPEEMHTRLIDAVHGVLGHPHFPADHKAEYGKILGILLGRQAKNHAAAATPGAGPGGAQLAQDNGYPAGQMSPVPANPLLAALTGPRPGMGGVQGAEGEATPYTSGAPSFHDLALGLLGQPPATPFALQPHPLLRLLGR